ncbi:stage III sporulation protein AF [Thermosyntropha sp.]|uniref:stage III sporulation protein AF n=1 Tax=Thermosyntropha sp. TaxID=2740820 RepID=UPI0025CE348D|nr:stage III sporulation protein AF [Thermosyntropha sp.]MBO8159205.1 stage III sporulation protein AF [Thermosyntropha sp.]
MSVLAGIVKNIVVIIIVASFFEIILPEGRLKPFVRFAVGLFILISVLNPALSYIFSNREIEINMWDYTEKYVDENEILSKGSTLNNEIKKRKDAAIREKLEGQISAVALLFPQVENVNTEVYISDNGKLEKVYMVVKTKSRERTFSGDKIGVFADKGYMDEEEQEFIEKKIVNVVQNLYGLDGDYIQIEFEGG